jgi:hypothetical protein
LIKAASNIGMDNGTEEDNISAASKTKLRDDTPKAARAESKQRDSRSSSPFIVKIGKLKEKISTLMAKLTFKS